MKAVRYMQSEFGKVVVGVFSILLGTSVSFGQLGFTDVTDIHQIAHSFTGSFGGGVSFADFNGDHLDDITFATQLGQPLKLYQNTGNGFLEIASPVPTLAEVKQVNWVDIDNDGDKDLYLNVYDDSCRLYINDGNFNFQDITLSADIIVEAFTYSSIWGDINNDGFLDLFICIRSQTEPCRMYLNNGDLTFTDVTLSSGIADVDDLALSAVFFDYDNDNDLDLQISNDKFSTQNKLFQNDGSGNFTDVSIPSGLDVWIDAMSSTIGDYNQDGFFDLYVSNGVGGQGSEFFFNNGDGTFTNIAPLNGTTFDGVAWSAQFFDAEYDMDIDLYVTGQNNQVNNVPSSLYINDGSGNFAVPSNIGLEGDTLNSFSNAIGDFNDDGFVDYVTSTMTDSSLLFMNNGNANHWLKVNLEGTVSNRDGIGSRITVSVNGTHYRNFTNCGEAYLSQNSFSEFFGLGTNTHADSLSVLWPSGHIDRFYNLAADQHLFIVEGETAPFDTGLTVVQPTDCSDLNAEIYAAPGYTYVWSSGQTSDSISINTNGTYSAVLTNIFGFSAATDTVSVTLQWPPAVVDVTVNDALCAMSADGSIDLTFISAPTGTVQWSNGATTLSLSNASAGWYAYTATDQMGCVTSDSVYVSAPTPLVLSTLSNPEINGQDGSASVFVWGGTPSYTYLWDDPLAQTSATATGLSGGTYTVLITDGNGCIDSAEVVINSTLNVASPKASEGIFLSPNPVNTFFHLSNGVDVTEVRLLSANGRLIQAWSAPEVHQQFDVSSLASGVYFVQIKEHQGVEYNLKLTKR